MADGQKNGVLIFTFSPVQGFIEASRRTRDFFTGSYILSWLTFQVMWKLKKRNGFNEKDFIYPVPDDQPLWKLFAGSSVVNAELLAIANFPNRFVLRLKAKYDEKAKKELIKNVKEYFNEAWKEIYECVFEDFRKTLRQKNLFEDEIHEDNVEEQFEQHVENYFTPFVVIVDELEVDEKHEENIERYKNLFKDTEAENLDEILKKQKDSYGFTYDFAERILGSRKTFRPYSGLVDNYTYKGSKGTYIGPDGCSVCGERKSLAIHWGRLKGDYDIQDDKLCGVCLVKRIGYKYFEGEMGDVIDISLMKNFPSTREMAGIRFKLMVLDDKEFLKSYEDYIKKVPGEYKEANRTASVKFVRKKNEKSNFVKHDSTLYHQDEWRNLSKEAKEKGLSFPELPSIGIKHRNSYFAIVYADGDHMGKWLGLKQEIRGEQLTDRFHRKFSSALSAYALNDVPRIVEEEHPGKLVYAGGDDVFAFMHPWDVMPILSELRKSFENRLSGFPTAGDNRPSISAGIVIGHAKAPLKRLIRKVREAEKRAKGDFGRNAFVIRVVVRSGSVWDFGGKWEYYQDGYKLEVPEIFDKTVDLLKKEGASINELRCNLSSNFVYDLRDMLQSFDEETLDEKTLEVFKILFKRSFQRKFSCTGNDKKAKKRAMEEQMEEYLTLLEAMVRNHVGDDGEKKGNKLYRIVENFINMFYVARFVAKEERV